MQLHVQQEHSTHININHVSTNAQYYRCTCIIWTQKAIGIATNGCHIEDLHDMIIPFVFGSLG